jgi:UDP-N-acetylmuramyl pentapeptide phosphotransferase/UDP-N-acetylglucosamine-1-phosphate transferase
VLHFISSIATLAIAGAATLVGYWQARQFTQNKLRYVDAVHKASIPVIVGVAAVIVATPVVWIVPLIGMGTAILFGGGVAMGVAAGARDIRRRIGAG